MKHSLPFISAVCYKFLLTALPFIRCRLFTTIRQPFIYITLISFLLIQHIPISAQIKNAGAIISYKKITGGIEGKTTNCIFDIHVYNDNIIRIRVSRENTFRNFSYALTDNTIPSFINITVAEKGNSIFISTNAIDAEIQRSPSF